jgi:signal transduction histidine kinase
MSSGLLRLLHHTALYSVLVALVTALYLCLVLLAERCFQGTVGYNSLMLSLIVGFCLSLGFIPLRNFVQDTLDRLFFHKTPAALADENAGLRRQLIYAERMKAVVALSAGVAHEIKNPLAAIKTFSEFLDEKWEDTMYRRTFQRIVGNEVCRIQLIVQQLLELARPAVPQKQRICLADVVQETLTLLGAYLVERHLLVEQSFQTPGWIEADPKQMKQVFLNLLLNSIDAVQSGGEIAIEIRYFGPDLVVAVRDNGCGIAKEYLDHIFDPFFTLKEKGSGLGLAVVQTIVHEHGGEIDVKSEPGVGTTFEMVLPERQRQQQPEQPLHQGQPVCGTATGVAGARQ